MTKRTIGVGLIAGASLLTLPLLTLVAAPAAALTAQECSAKYQAAKTAGTLNGQKWNDFRKDKCASDAAATPAADDTKAAEVKDKPAKPDAKPETKPAAPPASAGPASFPSAINPKFAQEPPAKGRLHTCAEQWKANKEANTTGGLRWIQKGGGYWSECNKRLKS